MKITQIVLRTLMGALFIFASITYLLHLITPPPLTGSMKTFNEGLDAAKYLMPMVKIIELACGILFVTGKFVPFASILISPIIINIFMVHLMMAPSGLPIAIFLGASNLVLAYYHREAYKPLFKFNG